MGGNSPKREYRALGTRVRELMRRERLNQTELAERIDRTQSYVSKVLRGEFSPGYPTLVKMAKALRGDIDELAHLAGKSVAMPGGRIIIPGWESLAEEDQAHIRELAGRFAELSGAAGDGSSPSSRDRNRAELVAIYEDLSSADREALLQAARDMRESAQHQSRPAAEEPTPLRRREGQAPA